MLFALFYSMACSLRENLYLHFGEREGIMEKDMVGRSYRRKESAMVDIDSFFSDVSGMYMYVKEYAERNGKVQTLKILDYANNAHKGQFRKGEGKIPYIAHPLAICCHAISLGFDDDNLISTALLHDVCEDCGISVDNLPVNDETREAVRVLTKSSLVKAGSPEAIDYYDRIMKNKIAIIVKLLDRCNNVSSMATAFSNKKMREYLHRTQKYVYPLFDNAVEMYPECVDKIFIIKYHMYSVVTTVEKILNL